MTEQAAQESPGLQHQRTYLLIFRIMARMCYSLKQLTEIERGHFPLEIVQYTLLAWQSVLLDALAFIADITLILMPNSNYSSSIWDLSCSGFPYTFVNYVTPTTDDLASS